MVGAGRQSGKRKLEEGLECGCWITIYCRRAAWGVGGVVIRCLCASRGGEQGLWGVSVSVIPSDLSSVVLHCPFTLISSAISAAFRTTGVGAIVRRACLAGNVRIYKTACFLITDTLCQGSAQKRRLPGGSVVHGEGCNVLEKPEEALYAQSSACAPRSVWIRALPSAEPGSSGTCINL